MRSNESAINIRRGETFTYCRYIQNKDGSPYVVSSELENPHWLVSIYNSTFSQKDRYTLNKWLDLSNFPRFEITQAVRLKDIHPDYTFALTSIPLGYDDKKSHYNIDNSDVYYADNAIFYDNDENGVISYKYWEYINNEPDNRDGRWVDYTCPLFTTFTRDITKGWKVGSYSFEVSLVTGISTFDLLKSLYVLNIADYNNESAETMRDSLINDGIIDDIDLNKPIGNIDVFIPISGVNTLVVTPTVNTY